VPLVGHCRPLRRIDGKRLPFAIAPLGHHTQRHGGQRARLFGLARRSAETRNSKWRSFVRLAGEARAPRDSHLRTALAANP